MSNLVITGLSKLEGTGEWGKPIPFGADATNIYLTSSLRIAGRNCYTAQDAINAIQYGFTLGNASRTAILTNHSAVVAGQLIDGTMPDRDFLTWVPTRATTTSVPSGYYKGGTLDSRSAYNAGTQTGHSIGWNDYQEGHTKVFWYNVKTTLKNDTNAPKDSQGNFLQNAYMQYISGQTFDASFRQSTSVSVNDGKWAFQNTGGHNINSWMGYDQGPNHKGDSLIFNVSVTGFTDYWVIMKYSRYDNGSNTTNDKTMWPDNGKIMQLFKDNTEVKRLGEETNDSISGGLPFDNDTSLKHVVAHEFWVKVGDSSATSTFKLRFNGCRYGASYVIFGIK